MAVERALTLYAGAKGTEGAFPEFYFFDCQSCHRRIYDQAERSKTWEANPGRPIPAGMPPFNDENMIMLSAAARVAAPGLAVRFDEIGRASWRERVCQYGKTSGVADSLKKKTNID